MIVLEEDDLVWARELLAVLDQGPRDVALREWIRRVDAALAGGAETGRDALLRRAVIAAGRVLMLQLDDDSRVSIGRTLAAAETSVAEPSEEAERAYVQAATDSYPFGQGDGCLGIDGTCEVGGGCRSGAGTLWQIALVVGTDAVVEALRRDLGPWLMAPPK